MKLCWDNLDDLVYSKKIGKWRKNYRSGHRRYYFYVDSCDACGEPYLQLQNREKIRKHNWCDRECRFNSAVYKNNMHKVGVADKSGEKHPNWKGGVIDKKLILYDTYAKQLSPIEGVRRLYGNDKLLEVKCNYCGRWYSPSRTSVLRRVVAINAPANFNGRNRESRFYCSENCKLACSVYRRRKYPKGFKPSTSREVQPQLRQLVFERDDYTCQRCGKNINEFQMHCHHIDPISQNPIESADIDNCMTLCKECHEDVHSRVGCGYTELKCKEVL